MSALHVRPKIPPGALDDILGLYLRYASLINSLDKHICLISSTPPSPHAGLQRRGRFVCGARVAAVRRQIMQTSVQQFIRKNYVWQTGGL